MWRPTPSPRWKASTREALDELAYVSQQRAAVAIAEGRFDRSLVPVYREDGTLALDHEEFPRPQTTVEGLAKLGASFAAMADVPLDADGTTLRGLVLARYPDLEIEHVHHAGNSSGVVDGAAAILLASPEAAAARGWTPRARIVATANIGDDPTLMLNAPVPAARKVLAKAGLSLDDIDLFEINEAFAVVAEKFIRDLDLDRDKVNVNGGAMALGHPIARDRLDADRHRARRARAHRRPLRPRHDVRRRRHGPRRHHRTPLSPARRSCRSGFALDVQREP